MSGITANIAVLWYYGIMLTMFKKKKKTVFLAWGTSEIMGGTAERKAGSLIWKH